MSARRATHGFDDDSRREYGREDLRLTAGGGIEDVERYAAASVRLDGARDHGIAVRPVRLEQHHVMGRERVPYRARPERHALVHLAREAPRGREVDEHRPPLASERLDTIRRELLPREVTLAEQQERGRVDPGLPAIERVQAGQPAPDFTLHRYGGDAWTLSDLQGSRNVVLVFFRGHWCQYCMGQLSELTGLLDEEMARNTQIVVVSNEGDDLIRRTIGRIEQMSGEEPDFVFLSDPESEVIGRYGVLNPNGSRRGIPHPATFVIDREGLVRWRDVQTDYTVRPSNEDVRGALARLD